MYQLFKKKKIVQPHHNNLYWTRMEIHAGVSGPFNQNKKISDKHLAILKLIDCCAQRLEGMRLANLI